MEDMEKSSCELLLQLYPDVSEVEELRSTIITNCVFNSFLSYTAIMLNIVTIHAIRKTPSLPKTLKTLLLSLAVSDVGVGLSVQPFYVSLLVTWAQETDPGCATYQAFFLVSRLFSMASLFGVVAVSVDRFLAIHLHLRYQELVTYDRVSVAVISIWTLSALYGPMSYFLSSKQLVYVIMLVILGFCFIITGIVNCRIYFTVRHHTNQIQVQRILVAQNSTMERVARNRKSAVSTLYVFLVFLVCYLPNYCAAVARTLWNISLDTAWLGLSFYALTLAFLNSSLNPVIYCWKMRHIRHAVLDTLRNIRQNCNTATAARVT